MRCPTAVRLVAAFRDLDEEGAKTIRRIARAAADGETLRKVIDSSCPDTAAYVRQMYSDPYGSRIWRTTVALHAIDRVLGTHGVEPLGPGRSGDFAPPYEYCNAGDTYSVTLIYSRDTDALSIGTWGDIAESHPEWR